jgi:hypothetical protein
MIKENRKHSNYSGPILILLVGHSYFWCVTPFSVCMPSTLVFEQRNGAFIYLVIFLRLLDQRHVQTTLQ